MPTSKEELKLNQRFATNYVNKTRQNTVQKVIVMTNVETKLLKLVLTLVYPRNDDFINHLQASRMRYVWICTILTICTILCQNESH